MVQPQGDLRPHTLLSLVPCNDAAREVIEDPSNKYRVSELDDGTLGLDVGFLGRSQSRAVLATLGRADTDIRINFPSIARVQCCFQVNFETNVLMLCDMSRLRTTQFFGDATFNFQPERVRLVVVQPGINELIGMGGGMCNVVQFRLVWHQDADATVAKIENMGRYTRGQEDPRFAQTVVDEADTAAPTRLQTRIHTPALEQCRVRYFLFGRQLGKGTSGIVQKAVDMDTGGLIAVKTLQAPTGHPARQNWEERLKREIEILSRLHHPNVIDFRGWRVRGGDEIEIFMELALGSLQTLVSNETIDPDNIAKPLFHQISQGLDYLACAKIIHRDVKPDNILLRPLDDGYQYQLADFGLSNHAASAKTNVGTPIYMAPEFARSEQSHKVDIYSFFVTMMWIVDREFRKAIDSGRLHLVPEVQTAVQRAVSESSALELIREMGFTDPEQRASAAQMLVKLYNGKGLTTPRGQVPALLNPPRRSVNL